MIECANKHGTHHWLLQLLILLLLLLSMTAKSHTHTHPLIRSFSTTQIYSPGVHLQGAKKPASRAYLFNPYLISIRSVPFSNSFILSPPFRHTNTHYTLLPINIFLLWFSFLFLLLILLLLLYSHALQFKRALTHVDSSSDWVLTASQWTLEYLLPFST